MGKLSAGANPRLGRWRHHTPITVITSWTAKLDASMGTENDLRTLVDEAHTRGIRILFDIVMNHTGYATLADMQECQFDALYLKGDELTKTPGKHCTDWKPGPGQSWHIFNDYINFSDKTAWQKISQFRARHPAVGAGTQTTLAM